MSPEEFIKFSIKATTGDDPYDQGLRNGLRLALAIFTGEKPEFEKGE